MYIFKPPGIGGEVTAHQDSTYLYTDPPSTLGRLTRVLSTATFLRIAYRDLDIGRRGNCRQWMPVRDPWIAQMADPFEICSHF